MKSNSCYYAEICSAYNKRRQMIEELPFQKIWKVYKGFSSIISKTSALVLVPLCMFFVFYLFCFYLKKKNDDLKMIFF